MSNLSNSILMSSVETENFIKQKMSSIIEAFVAFYGEDYRQRIVEKFANINLYCFRTFEQLEEIFTKTLEVESDKLEKEFLKRIGLEINEVNLKIFFDGRSLMRHQHLPIQKYIDYLGCDEDDYFYNTYKEATVSFLKKFNSEVTLENLDELLADGKFKFIDDYISAYKEILAKYQTLSESLEPFKLEISKSRVQENTFNLNNYILLIQELSYLFPQEEVERLIKDLKSNASTYPFDKKYPHVYGILGDSIISSETLVGAFSRENEAIMKDPTSYYRINVINNRIRYFKLMGIDLGDDYSDYENSIECQELIPNFELVEQIKERRAFYLNLAKNEFYTSLPDYQRIRSELDGLDLTNKNDCFNAKLFDDKQTCVATNLKDFHTFSLLFLNLGNEFQNMDQNLIHELNHFLETELLQINNGYAIFSSGWDIITDQLESRSPSIVNLDKEDDKRDGEMLNEVINELIAQQITKLMHNSGNYIFSSPENAEYTGTDYQDLVSLVNDFFEIFKEDIIASRVNCDMQILFNRVGEENFQKFNQIISEFYMRFIKRPILRVVRKQIRNGIDNENTRLYQQLINEAEQLVLQMKEYHPKLSI